MADRRGVTSTMLAPVDAGGRLESLDLVRGVAVMGILAMNVAVFAMPFAGYSNPTFLWPYEGLNRVTYWVVHTLFEVKMMSIFSMLFGAGVVLYDQKIRAKRGPGYLAGTGLWMRRMLWLLVIGLTHAYLIWEGDILVSYALIGVLLLWWVRRLGTPALLGLAALFLVISLLVAAWMGTWSFVNEHPDVARSWGFPAEEIEHMAAGYDEFRSDMAPTPEQVGEAVALYRDGWAGIARERAHTAWLIQTTYFPMFIFWRAGAMMLLGMALFKTGVLSGARSIRAHAIGAGVSYAVGLPLVIGGIAFNEAHGFDLGWYNLVGVQLNNVGSVGVALGHVFGLVLLLRLGVLGLAGHCVAAVGRMALTNYLSQSIICSLVFYGFGLGLYGALDRFEQQLVVVSIWAAQLAWSPLWLSRFRFGPAEWLWRSLTYARLQPMRRV